MSSKSQNENSKTESWSICSFAMEWMVHQILTINCKISESKFNESAIIACRVCKKLTGIALFLVVENHVNGWKSQACYLCYL